MSETDVNKIAYEVLGAASGTPAVVVKTADGVEIKPGMKVVTSRKGFEEMGLAFARMADPKMTFDKLIEMQAKQSNTSKDSVLKEFEKAFAEAQKAPATVKRVISSKEVELIATSDPGAQVAATVTTTVDPSWLLSYPPKSDPATVGPSFLDKLKEKKAGLPVYGWVLVGLGAAGALGLTYRALRR